MTLKAGTAGLAEGRGRLKNGADNKGALAQRRIAFFGHDASESTIIKRVRAFQDEGSRVTGFMFRRVREGVARLAECERVELGITQDRRYLRRLLNLVTGLGRIVERRDLVAQSDVIYARNIDMLALAVLGKAISRSRAPLVYEVLDIRQVFVGTGAVSKLFRWAERMLMARADLLVVSSPDYMDHYFHKVQGYRGAWHLLENKIPAGRLTQCGRAVDAPRPGPPWVIGMFGVLKCARSLDLLVELAKANPDRVVIHLRGTPSECDIPARRLSEVSTRFRNVKYFGPYASPEDLADIYREVHFVWSGDYLDPTNNSLLCLPNRLYEGCYFGAVALANSGTATARKIERDGLGVALAVPVEEALDRFIKGLTFETYQALRQLTTAAPANKFVDLADTRELLARIDGLSARLHAESQQHGIAGRGASQLP